MNVFSECEKRISERGAGLELPLRLSKGCSRLLELQTLWLKCSIERETVGFLLCQCGRLLSSEKKKNRPARGRKRPFINTTVGEICLQIRNKVQKILNPGYQSTPTGPIRFNQSKHPIFGVSMLVAAVLNCFSDFFKISKWLLPPPPGPQADCLHSGNLLDPALPVTFPPPGRHLLTGRWRRQVLQGCAVFRGASSLSSPFSRELC